MHGDGDGPITSICPHTNATVLETCLSIECWLHTGEKHGLGGMISSVAPEEMVIPVRVEPDEELPAQLPRWLQRRAAPRPAAQPRTRVCTIL